MKKNLLEILFAACLFFLLLAPAAVFSSGPGSFTAGERLTFSLRWEKIPAGEAVLEVLGPDKSGDSPALHFRMTAKTNSFVDFFYKVRDQVDSFTDPDIERSLAYFKMQREGSYRRDITVTFDWDRFQARYHNKTNGFKDPIHITPGTHDPLSVFYAFRKLELKIGAFHRLPVTDGVKLVISEAEVVGREVIEVPAGKFDCFVVKPELKHLGGVFRKSPDAEMFIWVTADERKMPVRISSKVVVGHFHALLTAFETPGETLPVQAGTAALDNSN